MTFTIKCLITRFIVVMLNITCIYESHDYSHYIAKRQIKKKIYTFITLLLNILGSLYYNCVRAHRTLIKAKKKNMDSVS